MYFRSIFLFLFHSFIVCSIYFRSERLACRFRNIAITTRRMKEKGMKGVSKAVSSPRARKESRAGKLTRDAAKTMLRVSRNIPNCRERESEAGRKGGKDVEGEKREENDEEGRRTKMTPTLESSFLFSLSLRSALLLGCCTLSRAVRAPCLTRHTCFLSTVRFNPRSAEFASVVTRVEAAKDECSTREEEA